MVYFIISLFVFIYYFLFFALGHEFNQLWKWGRDRQKVENHCFRRINK
jgi:hypothetical protein